MSRCQFPFLPKTSAVRINLCIFVVPAGEMTQKYNQRNPMLTATLHRHNQANRTCPVPLGNVDELFGNQLKLYSFILISFGVLVVLLNSYALSLFIRNKYLRYKSNLFLLSMTLADLIASIFGSSVYIFQLQVGKKGPAKNPDQLLWINLTTLISVTMYSTVGILNFCFVIGDRCYHLSYPFSHRKVMTTRRILVLIFSAWIVSITIAMVPLSWTPKTFRKNRPCEPIGKQRAHTKSEKDKVYEQTLSYVYPLFITFIVVTCLIRIVLIVCSRKRTGVGLDRCSMSQSRERKQEIKAMIILFVMFISLLLWVLPSIFPFIDISALTIEEATTVTFALYLGRFISAAVDPLLYTIYKADFWRAFKNDIQKISKHISCTSSCHNKIRIISSYQFSGKRKRNLEGTQADTAC